MASFDENERRIERLRSLVENKFSGNETACGRALGYKDGAFVRQMLNRARPITEKTLAKFRERPGIGKWFDRQPDEPAAPASKAPSDARETIDQALEVIGRVLVATADDDLRDVEEDVIAWVRHRGREKYRERVAQTLAEPTAPMLFESLGPHEAAVVAAMRSLPAEKRVALALEAQRLANEAALPLSEEALAVADSLDQIKDTQLRGIAGTKAAVVIARFLRASATDKPERDDEASASSDHASGMPMPPHSGSPRTRRV